MLVTLSVLRTIKQTAASISPKRLRALRTADYAKSDNCAGHPAVAAWRESAWLLDEAIRSVNFRNE
jgi:hypothetical protein